MIALTGSDLTLDALLAIADGESVGLHPMTVIVSVFAWSLILGGLLGAILAVPMTASLKVLFQRYIWQRAISKGRRAKAESDTGSAEVASA